MNLATGATLKEDYNNFSVEDPLYEMAVLHT